jgi:hypothetical protein
LPSPYDDRYDAAPLSFALTSSIRCEEEEEEEEEEDFRTISGVSCVVEH